MSWPRPTYMKRTTMDSPTDKNSLNSDGHRVRSHQMLDPRLAKSDLAHPCLAVRARIVESAGRLNEHVQAHEQAKCVFRTVVVNNCIIDNHCATFWQDFIRLL